MFPTFIGIGAQRAGTSWLYRNLLEHPDIWITPVKELHYFDTTHQSHTLTARLHNRGWRRSVCIRVIRDFLTLSPDLLRWDMKYYFGRRNDDWYSSLFSLAGSRKSGEITPAYSILDSETVAQIREIMPEVRIIFLMRDPVRRAWSHAINRLVGVQKQEFEHIKEEQFINHINSEDSRLRTDYMRTIRIWEKHFPTDQIFYGFYDDIAQDPESLLHNIYNFLQVDPKRVSEVRLLRGRVKPRMGSRYEMPPSVARYASKKYYRLLSDLSSRFGSHADTWLANAQESLEPTSTR